MLTRLRQYSDSFSPPLRTIAVNLAATLVIAVTGCERNSQNQAGVPTLPEQIRVFSWNLHRCEAGVDRIEAELSSHRPDIVLLQEAEVLNDASATAALLPRLARALGDFKSVSSHSLGLPSHQHCDVAILSRWPIRSIAGHALEPNGWVYAIEGNISTDVGDLTLMSVHTHATFRLGDPNHVRESTDVRMRQIEGVISRASQVPHPVIVGGDFNAPAGSIEAGRLATGLADLAPPADRKPTMPAVLPILRLDYLFSNRRFDVVSYETIDVKLSDHRPIKATITWPLMRSS